MLLETRKDQTKMFHIIFKALRIYTRGPLGYGTAKSSIHHEPKKNTHSFIASTVFIKMQLVIGFTLVQ